MDFHLLVITNETAESVTLREAVAHRARATGASVLVVAPALNTRLRHWLSDVDGARRIAGQRLDRCLAALRARGLRVEGEVGDSDPLVAIEDALAHFPADEIIIATHAEGRSNWLAHNLVERADAAFDVPVTHVVADRGIALRAA